MNEEIKVNRPAMQSGNHSSYERPTQGSGSKVPWIILVVVIIVIAGFGVLFRDKLFNTQGKMADGAAASEYQAVFLTNGQVYFGKMSNSTDRNIKLTDIYYLQVNQPNIQGSKEEAQAQQQPQLTLVKLGQELHGPMDEMYINRDHVLFYEVMKNDAKVVQAIKEHKANPQGTGQQQQQANPPAQQQQRPTPPPPSSGSGPSATPTPRATTPPPPAAQ